MAESEILLLLKEIAMNTQSSSNINYLIAFLAAIIGAFISSWGTILNSKSNNKANILTKERMRWLHDLRERTASAFTQMDLQLDIVRRPHLSQPDLDSLSEKIMNEIHYIQVMLNPNKEFQKELSQSFSNMQYLLLGCITTYPNAQVYNRNKADYIVEKQAAYDALVTIGGHTWRQITDELKA